MDRAYLLQHQIPYSDENLVIGVYSSEPAAWAAAERLKEKPGFSNYPGRFTVEPYELDTDRWSEGFSAPKRREIPGWGCLGMILLFGVLAYAVISREWMVLPFAAAYGVFFFGVAALAKRKADRTDFTSR